jgi:hypothetical protein
MMPSGQSDIEIVARVLFDQQWEVPAGVRKLALARAIVEALEKSR